MTTLHELEVECALHPTSSLLLTERMYSLRERMFPLAKGGKNCQGAPLTSLRE
jgi:hypothetical protein